MGDYEPSRLIFHMKYAYSSPVHVYYYYLVNIQVFWEKNKQNVLKRKNTQDIWEKKCVWLSAKTFFLSNLGILWVSKICADNSAKNFILF